MGVDGEAASSERVVVGRQKWRRVVRGDEGAPPLLTKRARFAVICVICILVHVILGRERIDWGLSPKARFTLL